MLGLLSIMKRFNYWIRLKKKIDASDHEPPYFKEKEIWWAVIGENIGNEINGKSDRFTRPILIIKKLDRYSFICMPLTSKRKRGSWYVSVNHSNRSGTVVICQIRHFDYRRLDKKMATLDSSNYQKVIKGFFNFIGK